jgi:hypothetical protein
VGLHVVYLIIRLRGGPLGINKMGTKMMGHLNNHQETITEIRAVPQKLHC